MKTKINLNDLNNVIYSITKKKINIIDEQKVESLGLDSLDTYTLILELEKITKKKISDNEFDKIITTNDILKLFNKNEEK